MIKSIKNAGHYVWGNNCDGWHLLNNPSLSVIQERMPAGTAEQRHFHSQSQQLFYILSGTATMEIEGSLIKIKPQESIHIAKGSKHYIANDEDIALEFLVISEPHAHGDRTNL